MDVTSLLNSSNHGAEQQKSMERPRRTRTPWDAGGYSLPINGLPPSPNTTPSSPSSSNITARPHSRMERQSKNAFPLNGLPLSPTLSPLTTIASNNALTGHQKDGSQTETSLEKPRPINDFSLSQESMSDAPRGFHPKDRRTDGSSLWTSGDSVLSPSNQKLSSNQQQPSTPVELPSRESQAENDKVLHQNNTFLSPQWNQPQHHFSDSRSSLSSITSNVSILSAETHTRVSSVSTVDSHYSHSNSTTPTEIVGSPSALTRSSSFGGLDCGSKEQPTTATTPLDGPDRHRFSHLAIRDPEESFKTPSHQASRTASSDSMDCASTPEASQLRPTRSGSPDNEAQKHGDKQPEDRPVDEQCITTPDPLRPSTSSNNTNFLSSKHTMTPEHTSMDWNQHSSENIDNTDRLRVPGHARSSSNASPLVSQRPTSSLSSLSTARSVSTPSFASTDLSGQQHFGGEFMESSNRLSMPRTNSMVYATSHERTRSNDYGDMSRHQQQYNAIPVVGQNPFSSPVPSHFRHHSSAGVTSTSTEHQGHSSHHFHQGLLDPTFRAQSPSDALLMHRRPTLPPLPRLETDFSSGQYISTISTPPPPSHLSLQSSPLPPVMENSTPLDQTPTSGTSFDPQLVCMYIPNCDTNSAPRKAISHIFGRNKLCTRLIPSSVWVHYCRKHYQRSRYRNPKEYAKLQCELVLQQIGRIHEWGLHNERNGGKYTVQDWGLAVRKREASRLEDLSKKATRKRRASEMEDDAEGDEGDEHGSATAVPDWLLEKCRNGYGVEEMLAIFSRLHQSMLRDELPAFPDVEILPNIIVESDEPSVRRKSSAKGHRRSQSLVIPAHSASASTINRRGPSSAFPSSSMTHKRPRTGEAQPQDLYLKTAANPNPSQAVNVTRPTMHHRSQSDMSSIRTPFQHSSPLGSSLGLPSQNQGQGQYQSYTLRFDQLNAPSAFAAHHQGRPGSHARHYSTFDLPPRSQQHQMGADFGTYRRENVSGMPSFTPSQSQRNFQDRPASRERYEVVYSQARNDEEQQHGRGGFGR